MLILPFSAELIATPLFVTPDAREAAETALLLTRSSVFEADILEAVDSRVAQYFSQRPFEGCDRKSL